MNAADSLYSSGNRTYAQCRPHYPEKLFQKIFSHVPSKQCAVDVGTGTGQAVKPLAQNFQVVFAIDRSAQQLSEAAVLPNVKYISASAERLIEDVSLEENSVDLITVATALHWFDLEKFYPQCRTVLKPGGCFAAFAYYLWSYPDNPAANAALIELHDGVLGPHLAEPSKHMGNKYSDLFPDKTQFEDFEFFSVDSKVKMTVARCAGFLSTLSGYKQYRSVNSDAPDPLNEFCQKTMSALGLTDPHEEFDVDWEFFGFVARKPKGA